MTYARAQCDPPGQDGPREHVELRCTGCMHHLVYEGEEKHYCRADGQAAIRIDSCDTYSTPGWCPRLKEHPK